MSTSMFRACLSLPRNPREAGLIADNLESLARALREWPADDWRKIVTTPVADPEGASSGLFERLVARTAPVALDSRQRARALESAEDVAGVLRVLWPDASDRGSRSYTDGDLLLVST